MEKAEIYAGPGCAFCMAAKRLLGMKNPPYAEHDVRNPEPLRAMRAHAAGRTS